ncbi:cysteine desulfurase activator complex subunit SufB, partial [mine drainage metagenome]
MNTTLQQLVNQPYRHGFVTDIETEVVPKGLNEAVIRMISAKKGEPEWLLDFRLASYQRWLTMEDPSWAKVSHAPIDFQEIIYFAQPKPKKQLGSMDEVDPELRKTFEKLGVPLHEQKVMTGVAVDVIFDSVSVTTTYKAKLAEVGIIFCSLSE